MLSGATIILVLKVLVSLVTVLFTSSLGALILGQKKLHGQINRLFFALTMLTVLVFELIIRLGTDVTSQFSMEAREWLRIHLYFSIPSAVVMPVMLITGIKQMRALHISLGILFLFLWLGTFVTGVFCLPHE